MYSQELNINSKLKHDYIILNRIFSKGVFKRLLYHINMHTNEL